MIQFTIPGQPVAKGRPKFTVRGGFASAYTPAKTKAYETLVAGIAMRAMAGRPPSDRAIEVLLELRMEIPVSWSKAKRLAASVGTVRATKKPDADNVLKGVKDACNGIVWVDDSQVVVITVRKLYHAEPCVVIAVREVEGEPA
ncbi:MAG: RusA family crossover junction endodeoxyribonuclease [Pseudomonadota bacterium]